MLGTQDFFYEPIVGLSRSPVGFATGVFKVGAGSKHRTAVAALVSTARNFWLSVCPRVSFLFFVAAGFGRFVVRFVYEAFVAFRVLDSILPKYVVVACGSQPMQTKMEVPRTVERVAALAFDRRSEWEVRPP